MNKLSNIWLLVSITLFSLSAHAQRPYGMGGCGLGSVMMGAEGNQVLAITTNELSTQTFSITSGTSNCVDDEDKNELAINFIEGNYQILTKEAAQGHGESLMHLAYIYGERDSSLFASKLQQNYTRIFEVHPNPEKTHSRILELL